MHSGRRLKQALKILNLRPTQLAEEIGVTYENIRYYMSLEQFSRVIIANVEPPLEKRGVNIKRFLDEEEPLMLEERSPDLEKIYKVLCRIESLLIERLPDTD